MALGKTVIESAAAAGSVARGQACTCVTCLAREERDRWATRSRRGQDAFAVVQRVWPRGFDILVRYAAAGGVGFASEVAAGGACAGLAADLDAFSGSSLLANPIPYVRRRRYQDGQCRRSSALPLCPRRWAWSASVARMPSRRPCADHLRAGDERTTRRRRDAARGLRSAIALDRLRDVPQSPPRRPVSSRAARDAVKRVSAGAAHLPPSRRSSRCVSLSSILLLMALGLAIVSG